jgi:hypothetical protein
LTHSEDEQRPKRGKYITFADLMRPRRDREERVMIVYGDAVRRADVWERKGLARRIVCEGLIKAALELIYQEEDPRDWLSLFRHATEAAQAHENRVRDTLLGGTLPPPDSSNRN